LIFESFRRLKELPGEEGPKRERAVTECQNALEISCHFFNRKVIGKTTQEMLEHFLENILKWGSANSAIKNVNLLKHI